jgi:hypothetical protein
MMTPQQTLEQRLRLVEDKLAIYHLIASHPPAADTGNETYYRNAFTRDAIVDLGGGKGATGNDAIGAVVARPEHREAIAGGLCHFAGLPRVEIDGDTAIAVSYLQIVTPHHGAALMDVPGHGATPGFRIHRVGANRWDLVRTADGWKVKRRMLRPLDGSKDARELLAQAVADLPLFISR